MKQRTNLNRRSFLKVAGLSSGGIIVSAFWLPSSKGSDKATTSDPVSNPWFIAQFNSDGTLLLRLAKQEMGQSAQSGIAMLFAEELGVDWSKVSVSQISYNARSNALYESPLGGTTGGSSSVSSVWETTRKIGASVREMLIQAASQHWKVSSKNCATLSGNVVHTPSQRKIPFH